MTDNSEQYRALKIELRHEALAATGAARVLDLCCGLGEMWLEVWCRAAEYLGVDHRTWRSDEPHRRLVIDNRVAIEALDLQRFNVFDVDVYGEPWPLALVLARRRRWAAGEVGALVLTDGGGRFLRYGKVSAALLELAPTHPELGRVELQTIIEDMHRWAVASWCARSGVRPVSFKLGGGFTGGVGAQNMVYSAVVFEGL